MEENQPTTQTQSVESAPQSDVSFPSMNQPKKGGSGKTLLILGALILAGILGYIIYQNASSAKSEATPTPFATMAPVETSTPSSTSTSKPADKSSVKIEVQNGTGIAGEAAFLQTELKKLGYTDITVGNAGSQDNTVTTVTFAKSLSSEIVEEITKKLKDLYKEVEVKTVTTSTRDALIVTGLRKGSTSRPAATSTPRASGSPTSTSTSSSSPSPSPTST